jgi:uncharacterized protein involved in outer membrane biogenesis
MFGRRGCLLCVAIAAVLLLGGGFAAYQALDPEALRGLAERQAGALLGERVTIGRMRVHVFPVPAVVGTDIRTGSGGTSDGPSVSVRAIRILPQWRTLVSKPLVIDAVEIEGLAVVLRRDRQGRWILPGARTEPPSTRTGTAAGGGPLGGVPGLPGGPASHALAVRRVGVRDSRIAVLDDVLRTRTGSAEVVVINHIEAELSQRPNGAGALSMRAALGGSPLTGTIEMGPQALSGSLRSASLRNEDLPALFALIGATAPESLAIAGAAPLELAVRVARDTGAMTASGRLNAARVRFSTLTITDVAAPFRATADEVVVEPLTFAAYGGTQRGALRVRHDQTPVAWSLDSRADRLDVNAFLAANTTAADRLLGTGQVTARLRGTTEAPLERHMSGTVDVALSNGVIRNFALLAALNRALRVTAGDSSDTRFERLSASLDLGGGVMRTQNASLRAGELTALAAGALGFDRSIDMDGTAAFSREASARMIASVREVSAARNAQGEVEVPFRITGSMDRPAFAINTEALLGRAIRNEIDRNIRKGLDRFLRPP